MSPLFLKKFKRENKCPSCPAKKAKGYSLCSYHLRIAREKFRAWSAERHTLGLCISCNRPALGAFLRCKQHQEKNRVKCAAWTAQHGQEHAKRQWALCKKLYRDQGLCVACREHRPCAPDRKRCAVCLERRRLRDQGLIQPWQGTSRDPNPATRAATTRSGSL